MCFTYVVYVCSDILLFECYLGSMERWGREASKTELKDMFQLFNDKRNVSKHFSYTCVERRYYTFWFKEHFYPFLNNSARLHFEKKYCIHGRRLKDDTLDGEGELLWNIFGWLTQRGQRPPAYQKGNLFEIRSINIGIKLDFCLILFDLILYVPSTIFQLNRDGSSWVEPVLS